VIPVVVGVGGALGAIARYYATDWARSAFGAEMPWGTLVVNVLGSLALGFLFVWFEHRAPANLSRELMAIGFLGSFTTFSTFSYETVALARAGEVVRAGGYAAGSVMLGVIAVVLGAALAALVTRA
jgi:CrcB protein